MSKGQFSILRLMGWMTGIGLFLAMCVAAKQSKLDAGFFTIWTPIVVAMIWITCELIAGRRKPILLVQCMLVATTISIATGVFLMWNDEVANRYDPGDYLLSTETWLWLFIPFHTIVAGFVGFIAWIFALAMDQLRQSKGEWRD
jgi:hypothetical protein